MKTTTTIILMILIGLMIATTVIADPGSPTAITVGDSGSRDLSGLPTQSVSALAGNVTQINITALSVTQSWQGYYGNVSGAIVLQNGQNQTFYNWTVASAAGEIYATRNSGVDFTTVNCSNATHIGQEESALGQSASDTDSVSNTFTTTTHPSFDVGSLSIPVNTCSATNAFGPSGAQSADYWQILLTDAANVTVYTTILNGTQEGYDGSSWDFQLLVGEDGHGNSATTTYFFYVELS